MSKNKLTLPITFEVKKEYESADTRFLSVTIDVLHTGLNLNDTIFTKKVVDENIDTIKNTPILGFIEVSPDYDFKGHEYILTKVDGEITRKYLGHAYGLIPESCNPRWITKLCDDGKEREFLQVDALMWTKFSDATMIMNRDIEKAHSMELKDDTVDGYEDDDGNFVFTKFSFDGCCVLGDGHSPAMVNSNIQVNYTVNDFIKEIQNEIQKNYTIFTKLKNDSEGGNTKMANKKTDFTQTVMELFSDVSTMVAQYETVTDKWGDSYPRYYLQDIQDNEAIVVDRQNGYQIYGFEFSINGDKPEIDFASCKRKKTRYEDYDENEPVPTGAFNFGEHIANIEETAYSKVSDAESKLEEIKQEKETIETEYSKVKSEYESVNNKLQEIEPKYNDYVKAEHQKAIDEINAQKDAKFKEFESVLSDVTEYTELKNNKDNLSVEEIENKCAVMYFKKQAQSNFTTNNNGSTTTRIFTDDNNNNDGENYVTTSRYGNIKVER